MNKNLCYRICISSLWQASLETAMLLDVNTFGYLKVFSLSRVSFIGAPESFGVPYSRNVTSSTKESLNLIYANLDPSLEIHKASLWPRISSKHIIKLNEMESILMDLHRASLQHRYILFLECLNLLLHAHLQSSY